jgi:hypothetical protein
LLIPLSSILLPLFKFIYMRQIAFREALREAMSEEMRRDERGSAQLATLASAVWVRASEAAR